MTVADIAAHRAAYQHGATTPSEVAARFLGARPVGGPLDAFVSVDPAAVEAEAAAATQRFARGTPAGPLDGILVGIKDFVHVAGYLTRAGTSFLVEQPAEDAELVRRLRGAGTVIAGKNRTTELGLSPIGVNPSGGSPRNPHDLSRPAGGSSSGGGAAVAGGLVPLALGSDGGGSLRIPMALCGVYGLKPTFGRMPLDGVTSVGFWSLDQPGPIARNVADLALGYAVMADVDLPDLDGGETLRVGVDWSWWGVPDSAVDDHCRSAVDALELSRVQLDHLGLVRAAAHGPAGTEVAAALYDELRADPTRFGLDVQAQLQAAAAVTAVDYLRAQQVRSLLAATFSAAFRTVDVLVTPSTACTAPRVPDRVWAEGMLDEGLLRRLTAYAFPANLAGLPAASVPVGVDADGLPVGLQLVGRPGRETDVLRLAAHLERIGAARVPRPAAWTDPLAQFTNPRPAGTPAAPSHVKEEQQSWRPSA